MPAEVSSATAMIALAAFGVLIVCLPLVLLVAAPAMLVRAALRPRAPAFRRGGYYAVR